MSRTQSEVLRFCGACQKDVIDITRFDEPQIIALFEVNPSACAHIHIQNAVCDIELINAPADKNACIQINDENLPIITTARDITAINQAVKAGFAVDIRATKPTDAPEHTVCLFQDLNGEYRLEEVDLGGYPPQEAIRTYYKSGVNASAFAAYMIPSHFEVGTRVFVPDVIEHLVYSSRQNDHEYRVNSSCAVWDGEHIIIDDVEPIQYIG